MTVIEIETEVEAYLNRVGVPAVASRIATWVQDELRDWSENALWPPTKPVNEREGGRRRPGDCHDWSFLRSTYDFTTVADQQNYSLSSLTGFLRPVRVWFEFTYGDRVTYLELEVLRQTYYGRNASYVEHYGLEFFEDGATLPVLWLFPAPLQQWNGHVVYMRKATAITGGQSNIFTIRWPDGIVAGATARGIRLLRSYEEAQEYAAEKGRLLAGAIAADRRAEGEEGMTLGISTVAEGDPDNPRPLLEDGPYDREIQRQW